VAQTDRQRFERLYAEHFDRVAAYLIARTDRESAGDALARTFEIAWRRLPDVPEQPIGWLLGVARRVLAEDRRGRQRRDALLQRIATTITPAGADHAEAVARREQVLGALHELSIPQQEALLLIAWDGLSEREAAQVLGCSRGALALRVYRARRNLRATLAASDSNCRPRAVQTPAKEAM
jgi:RNA polymerase sigma-70 factor (ECF subfamily)